MSDVAPSFVLDFCRKQLGRTVMFNMQTVAIVQEAWVEGKRIKYAVKLQYKIVGMNKTVYGPEEPTKTIYADQVQHI